MRTTHPNLIRLGYWLSAISIFVLAASGLQIFQAFPWFFAFGTALAMIDLARGGCEDPSQS